MYDRMLPLFRTIDLKKIEIKSETLSYYVREIDNQSKSSKLSVCKNGENNDNIDITIHYNSGKNDKTEVVDMVLPKRDLAIILTK